MNHLLANIGQYGLIRNSEGRLLVLERARSKTWCLPGGRLEAGEDWDVSFLRELREELNLNCENPKPFAVNVITDAYQTKYCVYFTVDSGYIDTIKLSEEHSGFRWIDKNEAAELDFEDNKVKDVAVRFLS